MKMILIIGLLVISVLVAGCEPVDFEEPEKQEPSPEIEEKSISCPSELIDKEYAFFIGDKINEDMLAEEISAERYDCVICPKGNEEGQNINYRYCNEFPYEEDIVADEEGNIIEAQGKILVSVVLKESRREEKEGEEFKQSGLYVRCTPPDYLGGEWVYYVVEDIECRDYVIEKKVKEENTSDNGGSSGGSVTVNNPCSSGCLSNGFCCPSNSRYYCEGSCYASNSEAMGASQGRCSTFRIIC